jgi:hypothetical protein
MSTPLASAVSTLIASVFPGSAVTRVTSLGPDANAENAEGTEKAIGYGVPCRICVRDREGQAREFCLHTARPDEFGHDRRSDRAANMLLAFDTFAAIPRHTRALDVGAVARDGRLISLREAGEFYLLTEFVEGHVYAKDLRRITHAGALESHDVGRARDLAHLLADIHAAQIDEPAVYRRAIRDLVGHGEGIFGLVDSYPDDVPMAPPERLHEIERSCVDWRFRLRGRTRRLKRTHGDFHPFNILIDPGGAPVLLDTSRGSAGDPADDVMALSLNYIFFALESPGAWRGALQTLYHTFFRAYLDRTRDTDLLSVAAPFLAWRALVMANPRWYPSVRASTRDALLGFVERVLSAPRFDPDDAERLFP